MKRFLCWSLVFGLLWWVITDGTASSWIIGIPVVLSATLWRTMAQSQGSAMSPTGLVKFVPFFIWCSFKGGMYVARRALQSNLMIDPAIVEIPLRLPSGSPRDVFIAVSGMLPGTLAVEIAGENLLIHTLDRTSAFREELQTLEKHIAAVFRLTLSGPIDHLPGTA